MSAKEINVVVDDHEVSSLLNRFAAYKNKTVPEIVRAQGRLVAVNLAHNTQPYGDDDAAKFKGQNAVRRDIGRVFIGPERVIEIAKIGAATNPISRWILEAVKKGDEEGVRTAWQRLSGKPITVSKNVVPSWHQSQRNRRGRVPRSAEAMIILRETSLRAYTTTKAKLVGFGKSGWAAAARALGGTRGIPGWVTRNDGPGGVTDNTKGKTNTPYVVLTNNVRYISDILPQKEVDKAVLLQAEKMARAMEIQFNAEMRAAS